MRETIAERFGEAGLAEDRFVSVRDGQKKCVDHDTRHDSPPAGNYGIYAAAKDGLVVLDVDDYNDLDDKSGLSALTRLEPTLEVGTPHDGTHRFYRVPMTEDGRLIAAVLKDEFGTDKGNVLPSWGEARIANQYVVGAGSELTSCHKDWHDCSEDGEGQYEIQADREIATVSAELLVEVLSEDPKTSLEREDDNGSEDGNDGGEVQDEDEILDYALNESADEKLKRLWRGDYSDYGGDRSEAESALAYKLAWWLQGDKRAVRKAMDRASTKKWDERDDDSYRESVLQAVDECSEYRDGSYQAESAPSYDESEVERAEDLLQAECSQEDPAGGMVHRNGHYGYLNDQYDDEGNIVGKEFDPVTNFTLETKEHLKTDGDASELLKLRVHPAHPMEDEYDVDVHPTVFNETRTFKEEIVRGRTTRFEPGGRNQQALNDLRETVGSQMVPRRTGVEHIGLAGDDHAEWVSPKGTIDATGTAEDPEFRYYAKGGSSDSDGGALARKWQIEPETVGEYDEDAVASIVELLPQTRRHDRGLPILGWFYAAPLRPLIHDWQDEFNLLQVVGSTGTGKTSTLKTLWEAFGMQPDPFSASDTPFTLMKHMASSNGIPVWIDEYKPADIRNDRLDKLHRRLREVTKGTAVSKGRANLGEVLFQIQAPVVVSGEQKFSQSVPAVRRRSIMTTLSEEPTREGTSYKRAFAELTGMPYEDSEGSVEYPSGHDLSEHARAYYEFILSQDAEDLQELWKECEKDTGDLLSKRDLAFEKTEFRGAKTILFGVRLYRRFADTVGADETALPTNSEVADAFEHYASNIGKNGRRRGYDDTFLELFAQATKAEYIEPGEDFRVVESQKWGTEVLAFHMPSVYTGVQRYVRDYNLEDQYNVIGKTDYLSSFRDNSERDASHVLKVNHAARLEGGRAKCVVIDPERTREKLGPDFDLRVFGRGGETEDETFAGDGGDDDGGPQPEHPDPVEIGNIDPEEQDVATVVANVEFGEYDGRDTSEGTPAWTATLSDDTDEAELVVWDEDRIPQMYDSTGVFEPDTLDIRGAEVSEYNGTLQLVVGDSTTIYRVPDGDQGQLDATDQQAAADGGEKTGPRHYADVVTQVVRSNGPAEPETVVAKASTDYDVTPEEAEKGIKKAKEQGRLQTMNDKLQATS